MQREFQNLRLSPSLPYLRGGCEVVRNLNTSGTVLTEWQMLSVMDDRACVARIETKTVGYTGSPPAPVWRYQLENHLGSSCLEVSDAGSVISREEHYAYGGTAFAWQASGGFLGSVKRYRYSGKECDSENGLYYFGARYYAAWIGRWTPGDPVFHAGRSAYEFCASAPSTCEDPDGRHPVLQDGLDYGNTGNSLVGEGVTPEGLLASTPNPKADTRSGVHHTAHAKPGTVHVRPASTAQSDEFKPEEYGVSAEHLGPHGRNLALAKPSADDVLGRLFPNAYQGGQLMGHGIATRDATEFMVGAGAFAIDLADSLAKAWLTFGTKVPGGAVGPEAKLVHLTSEVAKKKILDANLLVGNGGNFAGPAINAMKSTLGRLWSTGLWGRNAAASVDIPQVANSAFQSPGVIGILTGWQRWVGAVYTAPGKLDLATGALEARQKRTRRIEGFDCSIASSTLWGCPFTRRINWPPRDRMFEAA